MKYIFLVFLGITTSFSQGIIDGFFKGQGCLDVAVGGFYQHSDKYYSGLGLINYERTISGASLFAEYGVTQNFDVIASIPFINGTFQDGSFFVKYKIPFNRSAKERRIVISPAFGISFPLSMYATQTGQSVGQRATILQPKLLFQTNLNHGFFIQAQSGFNYAFEPVISSIPFSAKLGWSKNRWYLDAWFDYQKALGKELWIGGVSQDFRTLPVSYTKIGGVIYFSILKRVGIFINGSQILSGANIGKGFSIGGGLVYKHSFSKEKKVQ